MTNENIPYRGDVDHGVPTGQIENEDEAHYWTGRPVEYLPEEKEAEPVPVRIVSGETRRSLKMFATANHFVAAGNRLQVVGRDEKRTKVTIAAGAVDLLVGDMNVTSVSGFPVKANASLSLESTEAVYVFAAVDATFNVLVEYTEDVK